MRVCSKRTATDELFSHFVRGTTTGYTRTDIQELPHALPEHVPHNSTEKHPLHPRQTSHQWKLLKDQITELSVHDPVSTASQIIIMDPGDTRCVYVNGYRR